ncbi:MAG TPA: hypothetical protein VGP92_08790 [Acidimicrobiia bacterium]|jgi:hypothetical protein|nr:hypothetical protein [Acidimicrobiia bacterium]
MSLDTHPAREAQERRAPAGAVTIEVVDDGRRSRSPRKLLRSRWTIAGAVALVVAIVVAALFITGSSSHPRDARLRFSTKGALPARTWTMTTGRWQEAGGKAFVSEIAPGWTLAAFDRGVTDGTVTTRVDATTAEAGLAFRVRDTANFWALTAAPRFSTWNVSKVVGGTVRFVTNVGLMRTSGTHVLGVRLVGAFIDVTIDGHGVASIDDADLRSATGAGLVVFQKRGAQTSRWEGLDATIRTGGPRLDESSSS